MKDFNPYLSLTATIPLWVAFMPILVSLLLVFLVILPKRKNFSVRYLILAIVVALGTGTIFTVEGIHASNTVPAKQAIALVNSTYQNVKYPDGGMDKGEAYYIIGRDNHLAIDSLDFNGQSYESCAVAPLLDKRVHSQEVPLKVTCKNSKTGDWEKLSSDTQEDN